MASMAGLPGRRARVWVGPPLSPSGPSLGSPTTLSEPALLKQEASSATFEPSDAIGAPQFGPPPLLSTFACMDVTDMVVHPSGDTFTPPLFANVLLTM